jgi:LPXTG-motif cell wall-anchored protein
MNQLSTQQLIDYTRNTIVVLVSDKRSDVLDLLSKNNIQVNPFISKDDLLVVVIKAMKDSASFRKSMASLIKANSNEYSNYVDEKLYADGTQPTTKVKKPFSDTFLGGIFTQERLGGIVDTAVGLYSGSLQSKQQRQGEQNAINYEVAQANKFYAQQGSGDTTPTKSKTWIFVVLGVALVGGIGFYMYKKRK